MSVFHLIQRPISGNTLIAQLERYYSDNDSIMLLNDAVFSLPSLYEFQPLWQLDRCPGSIYAIKEHIESRGLLDLLIDEKLELIDYQKFVELSLEAEKLIAW